MKRSRKAAATFAQQSGSDFEDWVKRHHTEALRLGIVAGPVEHNEPHWRKIDGDWQRVAPGVADFTGVLYDGHGGSLATEAKCYTNRLPRSEITAKQEQHLDTVVRGGGKAFLLVRLLDEFDDATFQTEYAVPWQLVPWKIARTAESVTSKELAPWLIPPDCTCYLERYCPVRGIPAPGRAGGQRPRFPRE